MGKSGGASRTSRTVAERRGGGAGSASSIASLHATSARLQREQRLAREVKPGERLQIVQRVDPHRFGPDQHGVQLLNAFHTAYGDHQIGAALATQTHPELRTMAREIGVTPGRSPAETVSRITAHVTHGRYGANFGVEKTATTKTSAHEAKSRAYEAKIAKARDALAKLEAEYAAHQRGETKTKESSARTRSTITPAPRPIKGADLSTFSAFGKLDPYRVREGFGDHQLRAVLMKATLPLLREAVSVVQARRPGTQPAKLNTKKPMVDYIMEHVAPGN